MSLVERSALLPYAAAEIYALVNDVARYREFLPFCIASEVLSQEGQEMTARIAFSRLGMAQALVTRNRLQAPERIDMTLESGPFEALRGQWQFQALQASACKVSFRVEFKVQARFLQFAASSALNQAAGQAVEAFQRRAVQIYGKR